MLALTRAGGGGFDGKATSWSVNGTRDGLTLNGLPAGFVLSSGRLCRVRVDHFQPGPPGTGAGGRACRGQRIGRRHNGSRAAAGVAGPGGAVANLEKPACLMKLIPGSIQLGGKTRSDAMVGSIKALQQLLP